MANCISQSFKHHADKDYSGKLVCVMVLKLPKGLGFNSTNYLSARMMGKIE